MTTLDRLRRDPVLAAGVLGGTLTALAGVGGYFVVPLATSDAIAGGSVGSGVDLTYQVLLYFVTRPLGHHALVLGLVPFVCGFGAALVAGRDTALDWTAAAKIVGGIVAGPAVVILLGFVASLFLIGLTDFVGAVPYAFLFGLLVVVVLVGIVGAAGAVSATGGYLLARAVTPTRHDSSHQ